MSDSSIDPSLSGGGMSGNFGGSGSIGTIGGGFPSGSPATNFPGTNNSPNANNPSGNNPSEQEEEPKCVVSHYVYKKCDNPCNVYLSLADNPCKVICHVFKYAVKYQKLLNGIHYARKAINGGNNLYCTTFINPCTGNRTTLTGKRLLDIVNKNKKVVYKNSEEFLIGLIVRNHNFFRSVWTSYPLALNARDNGRLYCKRFTIPKKLFPNVKKCNILLKGHKIIKLKEKCC